MLSSAPRLKDTKMSVRTDLCQRLKVKRGRLATEAYKIRKENKGTWTRIRENIRIPDVWLKMKKNPKLQDGKE